MADLPDTPQALMKDKDGKRMPELELPLGRMVVEDTMAAAAFFMPVAPEKQEIV